MPIRKLYRSERFLKIIFGLSLFVVLCMGGLAYRYVKQLSRSFEKVEHTYEVQLELERATSTLKNAESGARGYIVSKDSVFIETFILNRGDLIKILVRLRELTADNPAQQKNLDELQVKVDKRLTIFDTNLQLAQAGHQETPEFAISFKEGRQFSNSIRFKIQEMINHEKELLDIRRESSSESLSNAPLSVYYVLILFLTVILLTYAQISKNLQILRRNNEQLKTFKESTTQSEIISQHGTWIWHIKTDTYEYSDNLYRLLGEVPQSFEAKLENYLSFVHPDDVAKLKQEVGKMKEEEDLPFVYYRIVQKNGTIKHLKAYGNILLDTDGDRRLLGTTSDITDEIESYRLLEEKNLELERNNRELESFNYVASHDLQEPLRKIQTFISRLEEKEHHNLSDHGQLYIERIKSASARMRALIDDLLQFSRTKKSEEALEVSNMNLLLQSAKQELADMINEKKANITSDQLPPMRVIPFQIKQLFENLMSNSLKYSREGVVPAIHIAYSKTKVSAIPDIKSSKHKMYHTISIIDNGIGFEQDYSDKIFVLFNRLHNKNEYSGTGIGLSICQKIAENHQGYIFAKGEKDKGATFTMYLPLI